MSDETEGAKRKDQAQRREFPETMAVLADIRTAMVERLLTSAYADTDIRENLYRGVQILDAMAKAMNTVLNSGSDAIEAYVQKIAEGGLDRPA